MINVNPFVEKEDMHLFNAMQMLKEGILATPFSVSRGVIRIQHIRKFINQRMAVKSKKDTLIDPSSYKHFIFWYTQFNFIFVSNV